MTTAQVVETSVTVNNNSLIQDYVHPEDQTQPFDKEYTCPAWGEQSFENSSATTVREQPIRVLYDPPLY